jgi:hypothetical protein
METYARQGASELPNSMWAKRTRGQIEKCAEAGALRKAFPEELGNEYSAEEMEGQRFWHEMRDITPKPVQVASPESFAIPEPDEPALAVAEQKAPAPAPAAAKAPLPNDIPSDAMPPDDDDGWPGPKGQDRR